MFKKINRRVNLKNETCKITFCDVFDVLGNKIGKGYSITRSDGRMLPVLADLNGQELTSGVVEVRHSDIEQLAVVCWIKQ